MNSNPSGMVASNKATKKKAPKNQREIMKLGLNL